MTSTLIVSASGIRGVVGESLDPTVVARFTGAYATRIRERGAGPAEPERPRVLLGRDSRVSGGALADAAAAGLRSGGCAVVDLGVVATPTALLAVQDDDRAAGGVIVTASHNPAQWNGLKFADGAGEFVRPGEGREVRRVYEEGPRWAEWDETGERDTAGGAVEHHVERVLGLDVLDPGPIREAGFRVALDAVRGAGGAVMSLLLERLGCTVEGLDLQPDGRFPRDPEPRPENLGGLGRRVRETGADLGMAVDPDGDRLALVDGEGEPLGEDLTLALAASYVMDRDPGPLVTNLSSSRVITDVAEMAGQPAHLAPVGEANVAERMREVGAVVGGEGNGGVMLPALHLTRDAPLAAALVLGCLAHRGEDVGSVAGALPRYHIAKRTADRPGGDLEPLYTALRERAPGQPDTDRQDGLRLDWPDRGEWVHVRPSGTEPILRVIAEGPEAERAGELAGWALGVAREISEQNS